MSHHQNVFIGPGVIGHLARVLEKYRPARVFLLGGATSFRKSGADVSIAGMLSSVTAVQHMVRAPLPTVDAIRSALSHFLGQRCEMIVAIGGGKVLDIGKAVSLLASQAGDPEVFITGEQPVTSRLIPCVALPTTAGSGSEATHFAVAYVNGRKYSLSHASLLPDHALIDPDLMMDLPPHITATSGMDAVCQAIESYWSIHATTQSRRHAAESLRLAVQNLPDVVASPSQESRTAMARAAHLAGKAINITKTTACHAISYPLTSQFGIPHGHAVALTIPAMFRFHSEVTDSDVLHPCGPAFVRRQLQALAECLGVETPQGAASAIEKLMHRIGLTTHLSDLGVSRQDIPAILEEGLTAQRAGNSPRALSVESLRVILEELL